MYAYDALARECWLTPDTPNGQPRQANPSVGSDPLTANSYAYVNGDPINLSDPTGHMSEKDAAALKKGISQAYVCQETGDCGETSDFKLNVKMRALQNRDRARAEIVRCGVAAYVAVGGGQTPRDAVNGLGRGCSPEALAYLGAIAASPGPRVDEPDALGDALGECDRQIAAMGNRPDLGGGTLDFLPACGAAAFQYFTDKGLTKEQAAGIVGNLAWESGLNPFREQDEGGPGRGLAQWTESERWQDLLKFAADQGRRPTDFRLQLDFIWHEFEGTERAAFERLRRAPDVETATFVFMRHYERPSDVDTRFRLPLALEAMERFGSL